MSKAVVVIGGSGFADKLKGREHKIKTPFGTVPVLTSRVWGSQVYAIRRHGEHHDVPPHKVNYKAHIAVAREVDAGAILASTAVGVINKRYRPGQLILCDDILAINLTLNGQAVTFFDSFKDGVHHTDMSEPFSRRLNRVLLRAGRDYGLRLGQGAVLALTYGPPFESRASIRALKKLGADLVGMTAVFEAMLAAEQGTPYAAVGIGTNWAAGVGKKRLSHDEVLEMMARKGGDVANVLMHTIELL